MFLCYTPPSWHSWQHALHSRIFLSNFSAHTTAPMLTALPTASRQTVLFSTLFWDGKSLPISLQNITDQETIFPHILGLLDRWHKCFVWDIYTWLWNNFAVHCTCTMWCGHRAEVTHWNTNTAGRIFSTGCPQKTFNKFLWSGKHACECLVDPPWKHGPDNFTLGQHQFLRCILPVFLFASWSQMAVNKPKGGSIKHEWHPHSSFVTWEKISQKCQEINPPPGWI